MQDWKDYQRHFYSFLQRFWFPSFSFASLCVYAFYSTNNPIKYVLLALFHRQRKSCTVWQRPMICTLVCSVAKLLPLPPVHAVFLGLCGWCTEVPLCRLQMERQLTATKEACPCFPMACYTIYFWLLAFPHFHIITGYIINKIDVTTKHICVAALYSKYGNWTGVKSLPSSGHLWFFKIHKKANDKFAILGQFRNMLSRQGCCLTHFKSCSSV